MQFIRFQDKKSIISYGLLRGNVIHKVEGSIFQSYKETGQSYGLTEVKLLTPCVPKNIYCVGLNFQEHIDELKVEIPKKPANFMKPTTGVIHTGEYIVFPKIATRVDYEGEMALVIKDKIKNVSIEQALKHLLGITPFNDVTERIVSYDSTQVTYSKSFDTFTSFGPIIDTTIDPDNTIVRTYLNNEKVQEGYTKDFIFSCAYIISYFSQGRTLFPGDIISTGTPSHVLPMHGGDKVEIEIEGIGLRLVNYVDNQN
jgi:2-keto-4-pentenoate hydratase/2-oxohepta-3-ene-1,7-dioic acid hydratase in catechol pathway